MNLHDVTVTSFLKMLANVDAWLRTAEGNSSGNAQKLVQLARQALAQQDLVAARQYLALALMEPQ